MIIRPTKKRTHFIHHTTMDPLLIRQTNIISIIKIWLLLYYERITIGRFSLNTYMWINDTIQLYLSVFLIMIMIDVWLIYYFVIMIIISNLVSIFSSYLIEFKSKEEKKLMEFSNSTIIIIIIINRIVYDLSIYQGTGMMQISKRKKLMTIAYHIQRWTLFLSNINKKNPK